MTHRPPLAPLMVVLDRPTCDRVGLALLGLTETLVGLGARFLWYRNHEGGAGEVLADVLQLVPIVQSRGVELVVGDRADVAVMAGAAGVHVPGHGLPVRAVREWLDLPRVGRSCHSAEEVRAAEHEGASYATLSPIFPTTSAKVALREPLGTGELRRTARLASLPVYALGGITPNRVRRCVAAGAAGVAVLGGILLAEDPLEAFRRYDAAVGDALRDALRQGKPS